jgi:ATP/maltotriose-dependent transcriptional regulator MalT
LKQVANHLLAFGLETGNLEAQANGNIFLGAFHYLSGGPQKALSFLHQAATLRYHTVGIMSFFGDSAMVYCLAYLKKWPELSQQQEKIEQYNNLEGGQIRRLFWEAYSREISLISGDEGTTQLWVKQKTDYPLRPITNFSDPNLALLRVCLTLGSVQSLKVADSLISSLIPLLKKTNNRHFLLSLKIAQCIRAYGMKSKALGQFETVMQEITQTGMVMLLIEFQGAILPLLKTYLEQHPGDPIAQKTVKLIQLKPTISDKFDLTNREIQVIKLLSKNLTNQEIANRLYISEKTVKRHSANLFRKLEVKNRREAARQAEIMELI